MQEKYQKFVQNWNATHSISKAPSFSSWKQFYRFTHSVNGKKFESYQEAWEYSNALMLDKGVLAKIEEI